MQRRAEQVDATRRRIVEAAVRLHTTVGPAATSLSAIAEEADVTRVTLYRHFADLEAVFQACTLHWSERHPGPDVEAWRSIGDSRERAGRALSELYAWFEANKDDLAPIYRDLHAMPRSTQVWLAVSRRAMARAILGVDADRDVRTHLDAVAEHLVHFRTWWSLVAELGLTNREVVDVGVRWLESLEGWPPVASEAVSQPS